MAVLKSGVSQMTVLLQARAQPFAYILSGVPHAPLSPHCPHPHSVEGDREAQQRELSCPRSSGEKRPSWDLNPGLQGHQGTFTGYAGD